MKKIFVLAILGGISINTYSQTNCRERLEQAEELYKQGKIEEVADKLNEANCIDADEENFSNEEKKTAHKLLTNTHLYYNEKRKAIESMKNFLTYDPEYKIDTTANGDSPEFIALYNEFRTHPIYYWGITAGGNYTFPYAFRRYSIDNSNNVSQKYKGQQALHVGITVDFTLGKDWYLNPSILFSNKKYGYESNALMGYANVNYTEQQSYINVPVMLRKYFGKRKVRPYIQGGGAIDFLLSAKSEIIREDVLNEGGESSRRIEGTDLNMNPQRTTLNYNLTCGGGLKIDHFIGKSNLLIDFRYYFNLNNRVKTDSRVSSPSFVYDYLHIDDDFRIDYLELSVSYMIPKFSPIHYPTKEASKKKHTKNKASKNETGTGVKETIEKDSSNK